MLHCLKIPAIAIGTFAGCLCIHELGHAIAGLLSGGQVTEFAVFTLAPHVRIQGVGSPLQEAFRAAAGTGFFLLVYFASFPLLRRGGFTAEVASWFAVVELLGWTLSSLLHSTASRLDDADRFLAVSGANRYVVAAACVMIGCTAAPIMNRRCIPRSSSIIFKIRAMWENCFRRQ